MFKDEPRTIDYLEKLKLRVSDLRPGMFVCELERPWLETPFLLQGFELTNDADIEAIMKYCKYVYIDVQRSKKVSVTKDKAKGHPYRIVTVHYSGYFGIDTNQYFDLIMNAFD